MELSKKNFNDFCKSGKFINRKSFLEKNPDYKLNDNCTDIVHYMDGTIIQLLSNGVFHFDDENRSSSLEKVEWAVFVKKNKE
jgi:hypothetical protein